MEYIVPAVIVLFGNLFSGDRGSQSWENVTAIFGWTAGLSFVTAFVGMWVWPEAARSYLFPCFAFCLLQALSRDYERLLGPFIDRWRSK